MRSPDVAFITWGRWNALSREEQRRFAPICPEFVIEVRSPSDRIGDLQAKMIDPDERRVEVYRAGKDRVEVLEGVTSVFGEGPVGGFVLETTPLWLD